MKPHEPFYDAGKSELRSDSALFHVDNPLHDSLKFYVIYYQKGDSVADSGRLPIYKVIPAAEINSTWIKFDRAEPADTARNIRIGAVGVNNQISSARDVSYKVIGR